MNPLDASWLTVLRFKALDAVGRLQGMRRVAEDRPERTMLWQLLLALVVLLVVASVGLIAWSYLSTRKRNRKLMQSQADRLGLSAVETDLLSQIARSAGLKKDPLAVLTSSAAFDRGLLRLGQADSVEAVILREKLGLVSPAQRPQAVAADGTGPDRPVEGEELSIVHRGEPVERRATIAQVAGDELVVESDLPADAVKTGETWLVRYPSGGTIWEFDARVLRREGSRFVLNRPERFRYVNRRRFPRVPTSSQAQVAPFAGLKVGAASPPEFQPGTVIEIAGPGMQIRTELQATAGQNVLTVVEVGAENVLEAMGRVRRVGSDADGAPVLVVELMGLSAAELASLVRATNSAALEVGVSQDASPKEQA